MRSIDAASVPSSAAAATARFPTGEGIGGRIVVAEEAGAAAEGGINE
jgi:hypothetical protein